MLAIHAKQRLLAGLHNFKAPVTGKRPLKRFAVYVNNGYRFELDCTVDAETILDARKEFARVNDGNSFLANPKNFRLRDVTGNQSFGG